MYREHFNSCDLFQLIPMENVLHLNVLATLFNRLRKFIIKWKRNVSSFPDKCRTMDVHK